MLKKAVVILVCLITVVTNDVSAQNSIETQLNSNKFINIVLPVRSRDLWADKSIENFEKIQNLTTSMDIPTTWLLQYDVLFDEEILGKISNLDNDREIGSFMEISEKLATDARVPYKLGEGDYYRTDKVLLSGYSPSDRKKLIDTYLSKFTEIFGFPPSTVGSWYIDSVSQKILEEEGVTAAVTVADQYDTDGASVWGKYYSMPFYPSKYNSLEPASSLEEKISIVNTQWAQRELTEGYGRDVRDSRQSFQANDYINNGFDFAYFSSLLDQYLSQKTEFMQITIGLEIGQEATLFYDELERQFSKISEMENKGLLKITTTHDFASYYTNKYQNLSPPHLLQKGNAFWFMNPYFRVAVFEEYNQLIIKDLRYYNGLPTSDYLFADENTYLNRKVNSQIDKIDKNTQFTLGKGKISNLTANDSSVSFTSGKRQVKLSKEGLYIDEKLFFSNNFNQDQLVKKQKSKQSVILKIEEFLLTPADNILYSNVNGKKLVGFGINNSVLGLYGVKPGIYEFPFQTFTRFMSLEDVLTKRAKVFLPTQ